ncbi:MAG: 1-acyl-sn-glycerol-3-phosphate acyltransferase [Bacteroidales bacterium]
MDLEKFEDIRPYIDTEVSPALERIANNPLLNDISSYLFPGKGERYFKDILLSCETIDDFQNKVMAVVVRKILADTAKTLTFNGSNSFDNNQKHLIISNHRDIVLDSAIIQIILHDNGIKTTEIAVGDNLITSPFIEDIARTNKMIKVIRSTSPREVYTTSQVLSQYIRYNVSSAKSSIWIAQRNGRTKDGSDLTEQGLLKMLDMSGEGDFVKDFSELHILPVSISYEYEPCDLLKTMELFISRRKKYVKSKNEDLNSILTGIMQFKGNIHIEFNEPILLSEIDAASQFDKNERFKALATFIDHKIISGYKLWKNNYIAYDLLNDTQEYAGMYSSTDKHSFISYMKFKLQAMEGDSTELEDIFLAIYANPVVSKKALK